MAAFLLTVCGLFLAAYGTWRSWSNGRELLLPAVHTPEEPTGTQADGQADDPEPRRSPWAEARGAAWRLTLAVGWLAVAMLGLFMVSVAGEVRA
ncbi:MAG TPA: hypothetical protein VK592_04245 [Candidatus Dormibacteraeota bacterium]|nr:hypothetical protein [Candidatus Dormibacteraeota bacterium]